MIHHRPTLPQGRVNRPSRRPGVLLILAALLAASAAIRIGDGVGEAFAQTAAEAPVADAATDGTRVAGERALGCAGSARPEAGGTRAAADERAAAEQVQGCAADPGTAAMLAAIRDRNDGLDRREARIADRERAVDVARTAIEARLAVLTAAEEELARTVAMADSAAEEDVTRLVAVYENMKPKDAIPVFAEMDPDFAAGFLGRMRADAAAAVLSGLDPKVAYTISAILAGRNANAPVN